MKLMYVAQFCSIAKFEQLLNVPVRLSILSFLTDSRIFLNVFANFVRRNLLT